METLSAKVLERFSSFIQHSAIAQGELTIEVSPESLLDVCNALRDEPEFSFKMLIDVCGVDYLHYGLGEWETESATTTGFERGVSKIGHQHRTLSCQRKLASSAASIEAGCQLEARWHDRVEIDATTSACQQDDAECLPRFAVVYHLLSLDHNHRIRLRVRLPEEQLRVPSVMGIWPAANWFEREAFDLFGIEFTGHPDLRRILTDYGFKGHPFRKDFPLIGNVEARYDAKLGRVVYEPVSIVPRILEPKVIRRDNRYETGEP